MTVSSDMHVAQVKKAINIERVKAMALVLAAIAMIIMAVALLISAVANNNTAILAKDLERSSECRFDENAEISRVNDLLDYWTWIGLKAIAQNDDAALNNAIRQGDIIAEQFADGIDEREGIVERCSRRDES